MFIPLVPHVHVYGLTFALLFPLVTKNCFYLSKNSGLLGALSAVVIPNNYFLRELLVVTSPTIGRQIKKVQLLAEPGSTLHSERPAAVSRVFCAGGKLTNANAKNIIQLFDCPVTEVFGSTETGAVAFREHTNKDKPDNDNLWKLLSGLQATTIREGGSNKDRPDAGKSPGSLVVWGGHAGGSRENPIATGDQVKFYSQDQFQLIGRNPHIHKIEGKRVSFTRIINVLNDSDLITQAVMIMYEKNDKETLFLGVVLSDFGVKRYQERGKFFVDKSIKKYLMGFFDPVIVPRTIRYLDKDPHNDMGKLSRSALINLLVNPTPPKLPLIEDTKASQGELVFLLRVPMELIFLQGHFKEMPIVPGLALVHWVCCLVAEHWSLEIDFGSVSRLKFHNPVLPGTTLKLFIQQAQNSIEFLYADAGKNFRQDISQQSDVMFNPVILIPVFQHAEALASTISCLVKFKIPLIVINDGSDLCQTRLINEACQKQHVLLVNRPSNGGKGAAVIDGLKVAKDQGYTHAFQIDADGQHDSTSLPVFIQVAEKNPCALILGYPKFDDTVPLARKLGRQFTQFWVCINTVSFCIRDSMCGFRIYPISLMLEIIDSSNIGQRMEFDTELCVYVCWKGMEIINLPVPVTYPKDGKSNFRLLQDNARISFMHARLFVGMLIWISKKIFRQGRENNLTG